MKKKHYWASAIFVSALSCLTWTSVSAASDPFVGEVMWTGATFCPRGWANADGQLLQITQNTALFSLFGTTYGGDGRVSFGLPDLRGRVSVHTGTGSGLSNYRQGSEGGEEASSLSVSQMPAHNHLINASEDKSSRHPNGSVLGFSRLWIYDAPVNASTTLDSSALSDTGNSQPHENRQPYLTMRACVALVGVFPSRN
ncbi:MAG: phage tail protein [Pseudomonadales bacterium]|nr:phage tail protein [Pseudomonadales bacterium]